AETPQKLRLRVQVPVSIVKRHEEPGDAAGSWTWYLVFSYTRPTCRPKLCHNVPKLYDPAMVQSQSLRLGAVHVAVLAVNALRTLTLASKEPPIWIGPLL